MTRPAGWRLIGLLLSVPILACGPGPPDADPGQLRGGSISSLPKDPAALAAILEVAAESLDAAARERYDRAAYDTARVIWAAEVRRVRTAGDAVAEARIRMWLGLAAWRLGDYPVARREGEAALAAKRRLGLDADLSRSFNALGLLAWNEGRHGDAATLFDSAVAAARRNDDDAGVARSIANLPLVEVERGGYDAARRHLLAAVALGRSLGDSRVEANALANLGMLEIRLGNPHAALAPLQQARDRYRADRYPTGEANVLGQLATAWNQIGDLRRAAGLADSGLAIARSHGLLQEVAATLEVMADLQLEAGHPQLALLHLREADSLDAALGLAVERGINLRREASILADLGETEAALRRIEDALAVHRRTEARAELGSDRLLFARILSTRSDPRGAAAQIDTALSEARAMAWAPGHRSAAKAAARLALDRGDLTTAARHLESISEELGDWEWLDLEAEVAARSGRTAEARHDAERAVAAVERERSSIGNGPFSASLAGARTVPFLRLVELTLALGDTAAAFETATRVPGRSLAERLGSIDIPATSPVAARARGERLLARVAALERDRLALVEDPAAAGQRREELDRALVEARARFEDYFTRQPTVVAAGAPGGERVALAAVRSRLPPHAALLLYLGGPDRLHRFVVRSDRVAHTAIPIGARDLVTRVRVARSALLLPVGAARQAIVPLEELHRALIGEDPSMLRGLSTLIVVPDGALGALPFAALRDPATGRYLAEDLELVVLPTASLLLRALRPPGPAAVTAFAPFPDSLPGTRQELQVIGRLVPGARLSLGASVREPGVRSALTEGRIVHLASHGANNPANPMFSVVRVAPRAGPGGTEEDGRLEAHEILGLPVRSPLVFLAGCETGLGRGTASAFAPADGEGSLAQAFLAAGADAVVATLWRVGDAAAARLVYRFYRELGASGPAKALALAQREAIAQGEGFDWAAFVLSGGEGVPRPAQNRSGRP
ncbi:MAG: CHAT domain-containing protein [Gemmatimonadales bacterium]